MKISASHVSLAKRHGTIWSGDMLQENLRPYNVLHSDNLCLGDPIADKIEEKIALEFKGLYISYRTPHNVRFLRSAKYIDTTWAKHPIQFYLV